MSAQRIDVTRPATTRAHLFPNRVTVRITSCGNPHWWYRDQVGKTIETVGLVDVGFDIAGERGPHYGVLDDVDEVSRFILPADAEVLA